MASNLTEIKLNLPDIQKRRESSIAKYINELLYDEELEDINRNKYTKPISLINICNENNNKYSSNEMYNDIILCTQVQMQDYIHYKLNNIKKYIIYPLILIILICIILIIYLYIEIYYKKKFLNKIDIN